MEIAAFSFVSKSYAALKPDLRQQPGKSDLVILTENSAQLRASIFTAQIMVDAAMEIKVDLLSIASYPLSLPAFFREVLCHEFPDAHAVD